MKFAYKKNHISQTSHEVKTTTIKNSKLNFATILLCLLAIIQVIASHRMWLGGVVANNDFIANSSYIKIFANIFETEGLAWSWNRLFNGGEPFLLFNLPPLTFWVGGLLHLSTGLNSDVCLKIILQTALIATPFVSYWAAKPFFNEQSARLFVAAISCFCTNEFYGLDFALYHGMTNAFVGSIFIFLTIGICGRYLINIENKTTPTFSHLIICLSLATLTHLTTLYMCLVVIFCFAATTAFSKKTRHNCSIFASLVGVQIALALALTAFWWLPSIGAIEAAGFAHFWNRSPVETLIKLLSGNLLGSISSYLSSETAYGISISGIVTTFFTIFGAVQLIRMKKNRALASITILAMLIVLGPSTLFPSIMMPLGFSLPHYRFLTLLSVVSIFVCSFGLLKLKHHKYFQMITTIFFMVLAQSYFGISKNIKVEDDFRSKKADANRIIAWLKDNSNGSDKTFTEFIPRSKDEISENYLRVRIPIETGLTEITGWNFENSSTGKSIIASGAMWNSAVPMIEDAEKYGVRFLVVNTETAKKALRADKRWKFKIQSGSYAVYSKRNFTSGITNREQNFKVESQWISQNHLILNFTRNQSPIISQLPGLEPTILKIPFSPFWQGTVDNQKIQLSKDPSTGYITTNWKPSIKTKNQMIKLVYSPQNSALFGLSISGFILFLIALFRFRQRNLVEALVQSRIVQFATQPNIMAIVSLVFGVLFIRANLNATPPNFPFKGAITAAQNALKLNFGSFEESIGSGIINLNKIRWTENPSSKTSLIPRSLAENTLPHFTVEILNLDRSSLRLNSSSVRSDIKFNIGFQLRGESVDSKILFWTKDVSPGQLIELPESIASNTGGRQKQTIEVYLETKSKRVSFNSIQLLNSTNFYEGESFENDWYDSGDGFYGSNPAISLSNGLALTGEIPWQGNNIKISKKLTLPKNCYNIWARRQFAKVTGSIPIIKIGSNQDYSIVKNAVIPTKSDRKHLEFKWTKVGQIETYQSEFSLRLQLSRVRNGLQAYANQRFYLDSVALVPLSHGSACRTSD